MRWANTLISCCKAARATSRIARSCGSPRRSSRSCRRFIRICRRLRSAGEVMATPVVGQVMWKGGEERGTIRTFHSIQGKRAFRAHGYTRVRLKNALFDEGIARLWLGERLRPEPERLVGGDLAAVVDRLPDQFRCESRCRVV